MLTFVLAPPNIKAKLVTHFMTDTSGRYMISTYTGARRFQRLPALSATRVFAAWVAPLVMVGWEALCGPVWCKPVHVITQLSPLPPCRQEP